MKRLFHICSEQPLLRRRHAVGTGRVQLPSLPELDEPYRVNITPDTNNLDLIVSAFTNDGLMYIYRISRTLSGSALGVGCSFNSVARFIEAFRGGHMDECVGHRGACIGGRFLLLYGMNLDYSQLHLMDMHHKRAYTYSGYGQDPFDSEYTSLRDGTICRAQLVHGVDCVIFLHNDTSHLPAFFTAPLALGILTLHQIYQVEPPLHQDDWIVSMKIVEFGYHKALVTFFSPYPVACVVYDTEKPWELSPIRLLVSPSATYTFLPGRATGAYGPEGELRITQDNHTNPTAINLPHWKNAPGSVEIGVAAVRIECDYDIPENGWFVN